MSDDRLAKVRGIFEDAANVTPLRDGATAVPPPMPPPDYGPRDGAADGHHDGGGDRPPRVGPMELPPDCPVTPLGTDGGDLYYYLDKRRKLRRVLDKDHNQNKLTSLVVDMDWVYRHFARWGKDKKVTGWNARSLAELLMEACGRLPLIRPEETLRGPGAHEGADGGLVLHCGDLVVMVARDGTEARLPPGRHGDHVYPAYPATPRPADGHPLAGDAGPAGQLYRTLQTWNFARPGLDPWLLMGWVGNALIGGAAPWRSMAWITGDAGEGKSTLQKLVRAIFGNGGVQASNATEAGLRQIMELATLPVTLDEQESRDDNRQVQRIIELARDASSGDVRIRGGADHKGHSFVARSAFLFSSILVPPLTSQDRSRMAILELRRLPPGAVEPDLSAETWGAIGRALLRRMILQWPRYHDTLAAYKAALGAAGHAARGQAQFGGLLACADLMFFDYMPDADSKAGWVDQLRPEDLAEVTDNMPDSERCLAHLMSCIPDVHRHGRRVTVARLVRDAIEGDALGIEAEEALRTYGMRIWRPRESPAERYLWITNNGRHVGLRRLFEGEAWAGGVWKQSLSRLERPRPDGGMQGARTVQARLEGPREYGTAVPVEFCLGGPAEAGDE